MLPFSEYNVVELGSRIGSGYCGKLLCNFGADVTLVEGKDGNSLRGYGPFENGIDPEKSGLFGYIHAGKHSVIIENNDLAALQELVAGADVLIFGTNNIPSQEERELFDKLSRVHKGLVSVHISPYGLSGPYSELAGSELTANALSGITQRIGKPDRPPLTMPLAQAGFQAGYAGASGAACALIARIQSSCGQVIEVSETEALATVHAGYAVTRFQRAGITEKRAGHRLANLPYPQTVLACADGYVELNTPEARQWKGLLEMMGSPDWAKDERFRSRGRNNRTPLVEELDSLFKAWLKNYTKDEFYALCRKHEVPSGPVRTVAEIFVDEQLNARDFFTTIQFPDGGKISVPGSGCTLSKTPARCELLVPCLGGRNEGVASAAEVPLPYSGGAGVADSEQQTKGPLHGLRILDMGWVWAGAIPGQILADMGAEVIKVESTKRIDYMRLGRPLVGTEPDPEQNPWFHAVNRNKKSITVNLKSEAGVDVLKSLVGKCDAVIENFKPGFLSKIGMDFRSLSSDNPHLVMLSMSGVGQTGPLSDIPAYAPFLSGLSGLDSLVGYPGEEILGIQQPYADTNAGVSGAFGLITALLHQRRTGVGQHIDLAESEAAVAVIGEAFVQHSMLGAELQPQGNDRLGFAPHGHYPTLGDDKWIAIAIETDAQWTCFCDVLGTSELRLNPAFETADSRWLNRRLLDEEVSALTILHDGAFLFQALQGKSVAAMPLLGPEEILQDPHFKSRGTFIDIEHPVLGKETIFGPMWRMAKNVNTHWRHAPLLGEHTVEVMTEILDMTPEEIERLVVAEVLI